MRRIPRSVYDIIFDDYYGRRYYDAMQSLIVFLGQTNKVHYFHFLMKLFRVYKTNFSFITGFDEEGNILRNRFIREGSEDYIEDISSKTRNEILEVTAFEYFTFLGCITIKFKTGLTT